MSQTSRGQHMLKVVIENLRFLSLCAICWCCSVSVVSDSLRPHGLQHARSPGPAPVPRTFSNSHPLSRWCHPTISSSVVPFSSCLWSFSASGSFLMSQFFASGGQRIGVSASTSFLPMNIQDWFPLGWTGWISLQSQIIYKIIYVYICVCVCMCVICIYIYI